MKNKELKVRVLGSVSPYCKLTKNCPGFLVTYGKEKILLDCGNGITSLLNFPEDLNNMSIIISHLHQDHYNDLSSIGYASHVYNKLGMLNEKVRVYTPDTKFETYKKYSDWEKDDYYKMSFSEIFNSTQPENYLELDSYSQIKINDIDISFSKNPHSIESYSIKLATKEGTIVYSGDTGYRNNELITFAENADLLICEATFLRGQYRETDDHLYAHEAASIAKEADVKKLLLTHFWPEIPKEKYLSDAINIFPNTEVAEEGKVLKIGGIYE